MPIPVPVRVSEPQKEHLQHLAKTDSRRVALRARIILRLAEGWNAATVAAAFKISLPSVSKWRGRWSRMGVAGLEDKPGRGRKPQPPPSSDELAAESLSSQQQTRHPATKTRNNEPSRTPAVTLRAIAKRARLSIATVSRALSDSPEVGKSTRQRIQKLAKSLGYQADPALSALVAYRARVRKADDYGTLALLSGRGTSTAAWPAFFRLEFEGMKEAAFRLGYRVEIFGVSPDPASHKQVSRVLYSRGIRGIVIGSLPDNWPSLQLRWERFSGVALGQSLQSPRLHCVTANHYATAFALYQRLQKLGYRKIGFANRLGSEQSNQFMNLSAYLRCLYFDGITHKSSPPCLFEKGETPDLRPWLERHGFDAVICGWTRSVLRSLEGSRFRVPYNLGLADIAADPFDREISGMTHDLREFGHTAVTLLHTMLLHNQRGVPHPWLRHSILIDAKWQKGTTVKKLLPSVSTDSSTSADRRREGQIRNPRTRARLRSS